MDRSFLHLFVNSRSIVLGICFLIFFLAYYRRQRHFAVKLMVVSFIAGLLGSVLGTYQLSLDYFQDEKIYMLVDYIKLYFNFFDYACLSVGLVLLIVRLAPDAYAYPLKPGTRLVLLILLSVLSIGFIPIFWIAYKYSQQHEKRKSTETLIMVYLFSYTVYFVNYFFFGTHSKISAEFPMVFLFLTSGNVLLMGILFLVLVFRIKNKMTFMEHDNQSDVLAFFFTVYYLDYKEQSLIEEGGRIANDNKKEIL